MDPISTGMCRVLGVWAHRCHRTELLPISLAFKVLRLNICVPPSPDQDLYVKPNP